MADIGWGELAATGGTVLAGVWTLMKAIVAPHVEKQLDHAVRLTKLENETVRKEDLDKAQATIVGAVRDMKNDLVTQLNVVQRTADAAHERLNAAQQDELHRLRAETHRNSG